MGMHMQTAVRGDIVWQIAAARRLLAVGSTVGIRPP